MAISVGRRQFISLIGGAAAVRPLAAHAQRRAMPVIGILSGGTDFSAEHLYAAFREGLSEVGFVEGQNVQISYLKAETQYDRLSIMAADFVRRRVAAIFAVAGPDSALAAKGATATIPIIFAVGADPVEVGLVASLNRPGGNVTGVTFLTQSLVAKRLELLHEMVPAATSMGYLVNPTIPKVATEMSEAKIAARILGVRLVIANESTPSEIERAFAVVAAQPIGAVLTSNDPSLFGQRDQLAALAARYAVPAIYYAREFVDAGGLMSYGASISAGYRLAGTYAGRILMGERPADLPVQQSTKVELVMNMRTAKALGLKVPTVTLLRADEVIE
jgi:putative tryptophan/tyrosine transport system substrate-binding protein